MRHHAATIEPEHPRPTESPASDGGASGARTWLLRRLSWENRLGELRAKDEGVRTQSRPCRSTSERLTGARSLAYPHRSADRGRLTELIW
jgi:hypothetical protein